MGSIYMDKDTGTDIEKLYGWPAFFLLAVGILLSSLMFYFMFKYAEEGNLLMVISLPLLVSIIAIIIGKSLVSGINDLSQE